MKMLLITGFALTIFLCANLVAAEDANMGQSETAIDGLTAWSKIFEVVSHPRCANCHVADGRPMWSGSHYGGAYKHPMYVGGDPDMLFGMPGMMCDTCHMAENSEKRHGPPGADVWHLPPPEMAWWGKTTSDICEQIKDPSRNGERSLAAIEEHISKDSLVAWGWSPGEGREPAPYSASETASLVAVWAAAGAPCPIGDSND